MMGWELDSNIQVLALLHAHWETIWIQGSLDEYTHAFSFLTTELPILSLSIVFSTSRKEQSSD
jgi:hypothetical protein